jgi:NAD(P)-dependent dehydrogenase (short-subunit alcohol dehydrogenase family)
VTLGVSSRLCVTPWSFLTVLVREMTGKLQDKVCLITGSTGIAAATAVLAIREGARVFVSSNCPESCSALADQLGAEGGLSDYIVADLALAASAEKVLERCVSRFSRVDALFNVAGISGRKYGDGPVHECSDQGWGITLATNVTSMFMLCRALIGHWLAQPKSDGRNRGTILNMASVLAFSPESRHFSTHAYAASKGAIIALSKAMASYYAPFGIRVNAIAPGVVRTRMSLRAQEDDRIMDFMKTKQPICEGLIEPECVARAAIFLLSDDSSAITGDVLTVDAGWSVSP